MLARTALRMFSSCCPRPGRVACSGDALVHRRTLLWVARTLLSRFSFLFFPFFSLTFPLLGLWTDYGRACVGRHFPCTALYKNTNG